jgi:hypothetical protein
MQPDHIKKPTPENPVPSSALLKEAITSVDGLSKSIREFPEGWNKANHINESACFLSAAAAFIVALLIATLARKGRTTP